MLFEIWGDAPHRPTRDIDLLSVGDLAIDRLEEIVRSVSVQPVEPDGIRYQPDSVRGAPIREDRPYHGARIRLLAELEGARISLQVDVGFGDVITPGARSERLATLLEFPAPVMRVYPPETVIAEKFEAMVRLGIANTRMKDFQDIFQLARTKGFDGALLRDAVSATFRRRGTPIPTAPPFALTDEFAQDQAKQAQWRAFASGAGNTCGDLTLPAVVEALRAFIVPLLEAADTEALVGRRWTPAGKWHPITDSA